SARVVPLAVVPPLEGLREALPATEIRYEGGSVITDGPLPLPLHTLTNPVTGEPGVRARFLDADGNEDSAEDRLSTELLWFVGGPKPATRLELSTRYRPETTGRTHIGVASVGRSTVFVDDAVVLEADLTDSDAILGAGLFAPPSTSAPVHLTADRPVLL